MYDSPPGEQIALKNFAFLIQKCCHNGESVKLNCEWGVMDVLNQKLYLFC